MYVSYYVINHTVLYCTCALDPLVSVLVLVYFNEHVELSLNP